MEVHRQHDGQMANLEDYPSLESALPHGEDVAAMSNEDEEARLEGSS